MSIEHFLPRPILSKPIEHALQTGLLVLAVSACGGGQPIPSSSPDNSPTQAITEPALATPVQVVTFEPIPTPIVEPTSEPTPSLSLEIESQPPVYTQLPYHFWYPKLGINTQVGVMDCGMNPGEALPNAKQIFSSACSGGSLHSLFLGHNPGVLEPVDVAYHNQNKLKPELKVGDIIYYTDSIGQLWAYQLASVQYMTAKKFGEGSSWADTTPITVITLVTCDNGVKNRLVLNFDPTQILRSALPPEIQELVIK